MTTTYFVQDGEHRTLVEVTTSSCEHPDVPQPFTVCLYTLRPCCEKSPATNTVLSDVDRKLASQLEAGTFLRGKYCIIWPDKPPCEQVGEESHASARSEAPRSAVNALPCAHFPSGSETWAEPEGQELSPTPEDDPTTLRQGDGAPSTTSNNCPSKGKRKTDEEIAAGITAKLRRGIQKLTEDESPVLWRAPDAISTRTEASKSFEQLEDALWEDAAEIENSVHWRYLLSSFCRIYVTRNGLAVDCDREESVSTRRKKARHDKGATVLCLIVDGLYPYLGLKALLYYWAACKVGYMLAAAAKADHQRGKPIAKLVIESLRYTQISVAKHAKVLHPGIFLQYYNLIFYNERVELSKVCEDLELKNLARSPISVPDSEVADWGVPISSPRGQLGADGLSLDDQSKLLSVNDNQEGNQAGRQKTQHVESQAARSSSLSTTTSDLSRTDVRPSQDTLDPYLGCPIEPRVEHHGLAEDVGIIPTESHSASPDSPNPGYSNSTSTQPQPVGGKRRASDAEGYPRSTPPPENGDRNGTETGSRDEQSIIGNSVASPTATECPASKRQRIDQRCASSAHRSGSETSPTPGGQSDTLAPQPHELDTPLSPPPDPTRRRSPSASHIQADEGVGFQERGAADADNDGADQDTGGSGGMTDRFSVKDVAPLPPWDNDFVEANGIIEDAWNTMSFQFH